MPFRDNRRRCEERPWTCRSVFCHYRLKTCQSPIHNRIDWRCCTSCSRSAYCHQTTHVGRPACRVAAPDQTPRGRCHAPPRPMSETRQSRSIRTRIQNRGRTKSTSDTCDGRTPRIAAHDRVRVDQVIRRFRKSVDTACSPQDVGEASRGGT